MIALQLVLFAVSLVNLRLLLAIDEGRKRILGLETWGG